MKRVWLICAGALVVALPAVTLAQGATDVASDFVATFNRVILFPTIGLLMAVAFLVFIYGCFEYIALAGNDQARQKGVSHITWGIIGLVVMVSAYTILQIVAGTFGLNEELDCATDADGPGCDTIFEIPDTIISPPENGSDEPDSTIIG